MSLTSRGVVLQLADSQSRDCRVQVHVGVLGAIDGVVETSQGQFGIALEVRHPSPQQQRNRVRPWHPLTGDSASFGASDGHESMRGSIHRGHRQGAPRSHVARLDSKDLEPGDQGAPNTRFVFGEQSPGLSAVPAIERRLHTSQQRTVVLTVKPLM